MTRLGEKLSDIMWNGPEETLTLTANAQPALDGRFDRTPFGCWKRKGLDLQNPGFPIVAGHSLGEYSALCAAGTFSLADTARLLRIRGNAMQAAVPVGQGRDGGDHRAGACGCGCGLQAQAQAARFLPDRQRQWRRPAGDLRARRRLIEKAASLATDKGAKRAILLPVSAPFHSALMAPAADAMHDGACRPLSMKAIRSCPLIANVRAAPR